ncbi:MAG: hypothetical protein ACQETH_10520 [Candidatus Rifleibacteriota bacterium]
MDNEAIENEEKIEKPPQQEIIELGKLGLPLPWSDTFKCALVILLFIALQIRFSNTILAEGWFAFFGFVAYMAMRIWLLNRRYPEIGDIVLKEDSIEFPPCVNDGKAETLRLNMINRIEVFIQQGKYNSKTSIVFHSGQKQIKINWLSVDLEGFVKKLKAQGLPVIEKKWSLAVPMLLIVSIGVLIFILALTLSR